MRFRNSLRLLMENFKHTYKLLWAKLIITLIASALCCAFLLPELNEFWNSAQVQNLVKIVKDFLSTVLSEGFSGIGNLKKEVTQAGKEVVDLLSSSTLEIVLCLIGCVVVYFLKRFVETIAILRREVCSTTKWRLTRRRGIRPRSSVISERRRRILPCTRP